MKFLLLIILQCITLISFAKNEPLSELIVSGKIKVIAIGNPIDQNPLHDAHTGKCLKLLIQNLQDQPLDIQIENGLRFGNLTSSNQDLITIENQFLKIGIFKTSSINLNALCGNKNNSAPTELDQFKFEKQESSAIIKLCKLLQQQKNMGNTAQQAMWCFTDQNPIENIFDTHPDIKIEDELVQFASNELHVTAPKRSITQTQTRIIRYAVEVEGKYTQWMTKPATIGIYITDTLNQTLIELMPEEIETRINGNVKFTYGYRGLLPKGTYYLQAKVDGVWKKEKNILITGQ